MLVEQEAGEKAPLWLREGLVETLAGPANNKLELATVSEIDAELAHPANAAASRHAHRVAAQMAALLVRRYGMPAVRAFLRNGVPPMSSRLWARERETRCLVLVTPNEGFGSLSAAQRRSPATRDSPGLVAARPHSRES